MGRAVRFVQNTAWCLGVIEGVKDCAAAVGTKAADRNAVQSSVSDIDSNSTSATGCASDLRDIVKIILINFEDANDSWHL